MTMQRALIDIYTLGCYWKNLLIQNFLELGKICGSKFPGKISRKAIENPASVRQLKQTALTYDTMRKRHCAKCA